MTATTASVLNALYSELSQLILSVYDYAAKHATVVILPHKIIFWDSWKCTNSDHAKFSSEHVGIHTEKVK